MEKWVHGEHNEFIDWYDTDGNVINASDGGIIYADGKYHWYGQALRDLHPLYEDVFLQANLLDHGGLS